MKSDPVWKKYAAEFIGTAGLVFIGTGSIALDDTHGGILGNGGIALAFGVAVTAMIYLFGRLSGAHINPAVSIGFFLAGRMKGLETSGYIISQVMGAVAASALVLLVFPGSEMLGTTLPGGVPLESFFLEIALTFALMFVIIRLSEGWKQLNAYAGIIIGAVIFVEAFLAGPISGASMNPARSIGPALVSGHLEFIWIYLLAPTAGSALAIYSCRVFWKKNCCRNSTLCTSK